MPESPYRQLTAIMFSDIAGYTAMMQADENLGLKIARRYREVLEQQVSNHDGIVLQHYGDGSLSTFQSAIEAVRCAREVQLSLQEEPQVPLRIGIHIGDIIKDGDDIFGDGINMASRVESLSVPGAVLLTERVIHDIRSHPDLETTSLGKYKFKNSHQLIEVFALKGMGMVVPNPNSLSGKAVRVSKSYPISFRKIKLKRIYLFIAFLLALGLIIGIRMASWNKQKSWASQEVIPQIQKLIGEISPLSGTQAWQAFELAENAKQYIPDDTLLNNLRPLFSLPIEISSQPSGVSVYAKPLSTPDVDWRFMGKTPLDSTLFPMGNIRIKLEKEGFAPSEDVRLILNTFNKKWDYRLISQDSIPQRMAFVNVNVDTNFLDWLGFEGKYVVNDFFIDQYEVTNEEFKAFIDAGGYRKREYWKYPFYDNEGLEMTFEEAMGKFVDQTGRNGPSTWEVGIYPEGQENHPVAGVSWYEAAAYADFVGKSLPSWYHNKLLSATWAIGEMVPNSNFNGRGTVKVGSEVEHNPFGIFDLIGNVREWCHNQSEGKFRFILRGGWNDQKYIAVHDTEARPATDRSPSNGFRCMKYLHPAKNDSYFFTEKQSNTRNYYNEQPVSNEVFALFQNQFLYDHSPLNVEIIYEKEEHYWTKQKISFDATYGDEIVIAYLFLPKSVEPPYKTILYWPGRNATWDPSSEEFLQISSIDFLVKSGRAVLYPVYKGTYERQMSQNCKDWRICHKEQMIMHLKDLKRSVDYLESRKDIELSSLTFYGFSWGGSGGAYALAIEKRLKSGVLLFGGFYNWRPLPEMDHFNYVSHIHQPVLMLNGKYDNIKPYQTNQKPFFDLIGTTVERKTLLLYEDGHIILRSEMIKQSLNFLDKYQGDNL
jgi:class 3 adenylate cyclase/predicted esterase